MQKVIRFSGKTTFMGKCLNKTYFGNIVGSLSKINMYKYKQKTANIIVQQKKKS